MMTAAELLVKIGIQGVSDVKSGIKQAGEAVNDAGDKAERAAGSFSMMEVPLLRVASFAQGAAAGIATLTAALTAFSGVKLAAQYQRIEIGFKGVLGSAQAARKLMRDLIQMGADTPFDTSKLVEFSRMLLATDMTASDVTKNMKAMAAAGAVLGKDDAGMREMVRQMSAMRLRPHVDVEQIGALGVPIRRIVNAGADKNFADNTQAMNYISQMKGSKAFDIITRGMAKLYGAADAASSLISVVENLGESISNIMVPTGRLLIPILGAAASGIKQVADVLVSLNESTGGKAGLVAMFLALRAAKKLLVDSAIRAWLAVNNLSSSLEHLAASARIAAGATEAQALANRGAAASATAGSAAAGGTAAKGIIPWLKALPGEIKAAGGIFKYARTALSGIKAGGTIAKIGAGALRSGALWGTLIDLAGNWVGDKMQTGSKPGESKYIAGGTLKGIATGVGWGSLGFLAGPIVGGITTGIGALIGGIKGYLDTKNEKPGASKDGALAEQKKTNDILQDIHSNMIGGGKRGRRVESEMQIEIALARGLRVGNA